MAIRLCTFGGAMMTPCISDGVCNNVPAKHEERQQSCEQN
jgi:hypothetical protein